MTSQNEEAEELMRKIEKVRVAVTKILAIHHDYNLIKSIQTYFRTKLNPI